MLKYNQITEETKEEVISLYKNHSVNGVSVICGISPYYVKRILDEYDVPLHTRSEDLMFTHIDNYGSLEEYRKSLKENTEATVVTKYGVKNVFQSLDVKNKIKQTNTSKYGVCNPMQSEAIRERYKASCRESLGTDWPMQNSSVLKKRSDTNNLLYGGTGSHSDAIKAKCESTSLNKYGVKNPMKNDDVKSKLTKTVQERYGVEWFCMHPQCRKYSKNNSLPNRSFANILQNEGIEFTTEFNVGGKSFDFKSGSILIEINPTPTHNINWSPFSESGLASDYHKLKSDIAENNGYRCIHVWDWDDPYKIVSILKKRRKLYARSCYVKETAKAEAKQFVSVHHLQGYANSSIHIGLFDNNGGLVSVMTFGKPRYNKKFDYELIRYCSSHYVIGGAEKLFKYFVDTYNPSSIISYCDRNKFTGSMYQNLGFTECSISLSKHWYNMKTRSHITDNLLRQRGFDQLLGTEYGTFGKGTSNEELMRRFGYDEIVDAGQKTYSIYL